MSLKIAILGAGGFVGSRATEWFHLNGVAEVRPIVRSLNGLARLSRFDLDCRIADARDQSALRAAFQGCDVVLHAVAGDPATIVGSTAPAYRAAQEAGVARMIYLSSASVHGQAPPPGTDETSPLQDHQPLAYNNAKVRAERLLFKLRSSGAVELVVLRPAIVTGPRSFWCESFAANLLARSAYLIDAGAGICNSIYIDNLLHGIHRAILTPAADGHAFLLGDAETVTWADLYGPIAAALGTTLSSVPNLTYQERPRTWLQRIESLQNSKSVRAALARIPKRFRRALYMALSPATQRSAWAYPQHAAAALPEVTLEMTLLYQCVYKLPLARAASILEYTPTISFAEGCRRTVAWLEFAGYPVMAQPRNPMPR